LPSGDLLHAVWEGRRIGREEALRLHRLPLEELGMLAHRRRQLARAAAHHGRGNHIVTYIVHRNVNYTNVCNVYCKFCAFYRVEADADSYVITFQAEHTRLKAPTVGAHEYLRTQALSRIYLDNFPSVQSSWVTQGPEIGQVALQFGANDLGSIMIEENVVSQAGTTYRMGVADMRRLIEELGYEAHQRDNWYDLLFS
jgi:2-iminoacetate synthase ThiH